MFYRQRDDGGSGSESAGWCRDIAGNIGYATAAVNIDLTGPQVSASQTPVPNAYGWNNTPVTASFAGRDALSGIAYCLPAGSLEGSPEVLISMEVSSRIVSGYCIDNVGHSSTATLTVNIDTTAPTLAYSRTPANAAGWNNGR